MYSSVFAPQAIQRNGVLEDLHDVGGLRSFWKTGGIGCFISPLADLSVQIVKHLKQEGQETIPYFVSNPLQFKTRDSNIITDL